MADGEHREELIGDEGLAHLAGLTSLWRLTISGANITDDGLAALSNLKKLRIAHIQGNITDKGLRHLEGLKSLQSLWIGSPNTLSAEALNNLREKVPNLFPIRVNK